MKTATRSKLAPRSVFPFRLRCRSLSAATARRLGLVLLLASSGAAAWRADAQAPDWRALSDTSAVRSEQDARTALESLVAQLTAEVEVKGTPRLEPSSPSAPLSPENAAQIRASRDQAIAAYQAQLDKTDPAKNPAQHKVLTDALAQTRATYAQMLGEAPAPAAAPSSAPPKTWLIPAFGNRQPDLSQAISNLQRLVADNSPPEALRAFRESEDYASASRCSAMAGLAVVLHRDVAALAAWVRAHELEPHAPEHLLNLAALTARIGLPRHTLTLLDAAEKRTKSPGTGPLDPKAVVANHRGQALVLLRRFSEAEKVLREAVKLEPSLSEARINLAHALYQQADSKKKQEAITLMLYARRRMATVSNEPDTAPAHPAPPAPKGPASTGTPAATEASAPLPSRHSRPFARDVFDLSRGKAGSIATIKIPQTVADAHAMWPIVRKMKAEVQREANDVTRRMLQLNTAMKKRAQAGGFAERLGYQRAQDVFRYIEGAHFEPELEALWRAFAKSQRDPLIGIYDGQSRNPWGSFELDDKLDRIRITERGANCLARYQVVETYHEAWLGPIHLLDTDVNRYARALYPHVTAIAANLSDPMYHEYAMLEIRSQMLRLTKAFLVPLEAVCKYDHWLMSGCEDIGIDGVATEPIAAVYPEADWCPGGLRGDYSVGANLKLFSLAINCEKVGIELSAGVWIKGFLAVDQMFDGSGSFFVGVAGDSSVPVVGVLGISATLKGGLYLVVDKNGEITDFGLKASRTSTVGLGPVSYSQEIGSTLNLLSALPN